MDKFRNAIHKFLQGRYGMDQLGRALLFFGIFLNILAFWIQNPKTASIINSIAMTLFFIVLFRMLSKNFPQRSAENRSFRNATAPISKKMSLISMRIRDRKTHKYVKCDRCKNIIRVPKGKGKVKIRCRKCGHEFYKHV
ncbi:MAG: hypothetical protein Q4P29_07085 [Tissierellia bacterium]|nr:hypothetical protein [Tissierellia bacterium]